MMNTFLSCVALLLAVIGAAVYQVIKCFASVLLPGYFRREKTIKGQNVLITGAGSGLGREMAIELSKHSVNLILVDINSGSLLKTEKLVNKRSGVLMYVCDVSNSKLVYKMAERIKIDVGSVDILINNAGIIQGKYLTDLTDEEIKRTMEVNVLSHFWTCRAFLPAMIEKNKGHIVTISSSTGHVTCPQMADYCASKFAAIGFAESLETELRERNLDGIKVTIVCPGHMDTGMFSGFKASVSPSMKPEYAAREVVSGILEEAETIYIPHWIGHTLLFKHFYPRWILISFLKITGDLKCMSRFTGKTNYPSSRRKQIVQTEILKEK